MITIKDTIEDLKRRKHNIRLKELEKLLLKSGFAERRLRKGTSHRVFSHPKLTQNVVLVSHGRNDLVKFYQVNDAVKALEELEQSYEKKS